MKLKLPYKVLIVDDEVMICDMLKEYLSTIYLDKLEISQESDSTKALNKIQSDEFNILITDINMPGLKGDDLLRKAIAQQKGTRVLILTADETYTVAINCFLDGASGIIKKPFTEESLRKSLDLCIKELDHWRDLINQKFAPSKS